MPTEHLFGDSRLDVLMAALGALHELGLITGPAISTEKQDNGTAITVEFLLDYDRDRP